MLFMFSCKNRITAAGISLLIAGSVAGCGASSAENQVSMPELPVAAPKATVDIDYEVPVQIPGIFVDQEGYAPNSEKTVVFSAKELPETFSIIDVDTGKEVYTGEVIKPSYDEASGKNMGIGRFNEFRDQGEYYIKTDNIGESYTFYIKDGIYNEVFDEACKRYFINRCGIALSETRAGVSAHSACHTAAAHLKESPDTALDITGGWHMDEQADRDSLTGSRIAMNLLMAYEMNPDSFLDDTGIPESKNEIPDILDEIKYEIEWLMKMQDSKSGGIYGAAVTEADSGNDILAAPVTVTPVSMDATINAAAALASFSYTYHQFDAELATLVLKAADRAFSCYLNNQKISDNTAVFKAAAQLYRATGTSKYSEVLDSYFNKEDFTELFNSDENIFLGSVTYLSTNQAVDTKQCERLMKLLMHRSEDIAARATAGPFRVSEEQVGDGYGGILVDMRCLAVTNHIIYNYEYTTIVENHLHYLCGMNPEAINYVTDRTDRTYRQQEGGSSVMNDPEADALLIFMMSAVK